MTSESIVDSAMTAAMPADKAEPARSGKSSLLLIAVICFGLAVRGGVILNVAAVVVGLLALSAAFLSSRSVPVRDGDRTLEVALLVSVVLFGLLGASGFTGSAIGPSTQLLERGPGLAWIVLGVALYLLRRRTDPRRVAQAVVGSTLALSMLLGILHVEAMGGAGIDVLHLHEEAAHAIANGENPYTAAVTVNDGAPTAAPGDQIVGYVYPPVTAVAYSAGEWLFGDPRFTSLAAWVGILGVFGVLAIRRPRSPLPYLVVLLAALPGWPLMLRAAWTEPFSLLLLTLAAVLWRRSTSSGAWAGLALASKQYFAVTFPVFLFHRGPGSRRLLVTGAVVTVAVGVGVLWDPLAFWSATVEFHTSTPPRLDSSNLVGLLGLWGIVWDPPTLLPISTGLGLAALASLRGRTGATAMTSLALALGGSFFVSSQAFANYWFMVMGICLLGLALLSLPPPPRAAPVSVR